MTSFCCVVLRLEGFDRTTALTTSKRPCKLSLLLMGHLLLWLRRYISQSRGDDRSPGWTRVGTRPRTIPTWLTHLQMLKFTVSSWNSWISKISQLATTAHLVSGIFTSDCVLLTFSCLVLYWSHSRYSWQGFWGYCLFSYCYNHMKVLQSNILPQIGYCVIVRHCRSMRASISWAGQPMALQNKQKFLQLL